jgi:hypothetical protein
LNSFCDTNFDAHLRSVEVWVQPCKEGSDESGREVVVAKQTYGSRKRLKVMW